MHAQQAAFEVVGASGAAATPAVDRSGLNRVRIIDATLDCLARHGTLKTTVDDIARRAGLSRATVYRTFPGGREEILAAVVDTEVARLFSAVAVRMGEAVDLTDALVSGIVEASTRIQNHAALSYLVAHEPETVLGHLAFDESNRLLAAASRFTAPFLARWMSAGEAERVGEWATRIVLSYLIAPSSMCDLSHSDHARRLVTTFMIPGIEALRSAPTTGTIVITPFGHLPPSAPAGSTAHPAPPESTRSAPFEHGKGEAP